MITNLNKENLIKVDVRKATVTTNTGSMNFYVTDINTCNIYCQLVTDVSTTGLIHKHMAIDNAEDFKVTMRIIKPDNEPKELEFTYLDESKTPLDALFYVVLTEEYKDLIGPYKCELFVDCITKREVDDTIVEQLERITTSSFTYHINGSIMNDLDKVIDGVPTYPLVDTLATKDYVDNIIYVIDKTKAKEGITYEDFKNGGCTCKLSGSLYFGDTYFTFANELVHVNKVNYANMKKLYIYRITTVAKPGGGASADYIILDYKEGTYEAYNYMLEEMEHKADQVRLDLMNIIDDANYAPMTYVNDSMKTVNDTTREYVNGCIEDITDSINTAGYTTESYVDDKVLALRTDFASNFAPLSYVDNAVNEAVNGINLSDYATHSYVSNLFNASIDGRLADYASKDYVGDEIRELRKSMLNFSDIEIYMTDYLWVNEYTTKSYVAEQIASAQLSGGEGGSVDLSIYATKTYVDDAIANIDTSGGGGDCSCDLSDYVTKDYLGQCNYATQDYVFTELNAEIGNVYSELNNYATREYVSEYVAEHSGSSDGVTESEMRSYISERLSAFRYEDLPEMGYATKEYVQEYVSENSGGGSSSSGISYDTMTEYVSERFQSHNEDISERGYVTSDNLNDRLMDYVNYDSLMGYATEEYVQQYVSENSGGGSSDGVSYDDMTSYVNDTIDYKFESYDERISNRGYITSSSLENGGYITSEGLNERFSDLKNEYLPEYYASKSELEQLSNTLGDIETLLGEI